MFVSCAALGSYQCFPPGNTDAGHTGEFHCDAPEINKFSRTTLGFVLTWIMIQRILINLQGK